MCFFLCRLVFLVSTVQLSISGKSVEVKYDIWEKDTKPGSSTDASGREPIVCEGCNRGVDVERVIGILVDGYEREGCERESWKWACCTLYVSSPPGFCYDVARSDQLC